MVKIMKNTTNWQLFISQKTKNKTTKNYETEIEDKNLLKKLLEAYDDLKVKMTAPAKLISGDDVMNVLGWSQGPQVGRILKKVEDLHLTGEISSREEAIKYIKKLA